MTARVAVVTLFLVALPAACSPETPFPLVRPAFAQVQTPAAGYHGIEASPETQRSLAERARARAALMRQRVEGIAPRTPPALAGVPHVLTLYRAVHAENQSAGKYPVAGDHGPNVAVPGNPRQLAFVLNANLSEVWRERFDDLAACRWQAEIDLQVLAPDTTVAICTPVRGTP